MNEIYLTKVNGVNWAVVNGSDEQLVPMKPICEALGITLQSQLEKLKNHPLFTSTIRLSLTVGADGKEREMACIPLSHLTGWMVTIHPSNVKEEVRERLVEFQNECVKVLHEYFFGSIRHEKERQQREIAKLELINELTEEYNDLGKRLKKERKELEQLRSERLDPQSRLLFD